MDPELDRPFALDSAAVARFRRDGFVKLSGVLSAEAIARHAPEITRLTLESEAGAKPLAERSTYGRAFLQVTNLWERSEGVRNFVFSRRLARIAAELLEVRGVRLYHDQALYKEPGGGMTPAHCDQFYWPMASDRCITAWVPLQPVPDAMGPIAFYSGSQQFHDGRDIPISDESERRVAAAMKRNGYPLVAEPFALGDVSFHLGWTFHRAGPNRTGRPRSVMTIITMDRDMRLKASANHMEQIDRDAFCPGIAPGEIIATKKNPILYEA